MSDARRTLPDGPLSIEAAHLSFGYESEPVLDDVSLRIEPGETVAVVGTTGSGKSTLSLLLAGLLEPSGGAVLLGGIDLAQLSDDEVRDAVAIVFQETFLFADSIRGNVTLGRPVDEQDLAAVLALVRADAFVRALPEGLDTVIGERGVTLSGGQRQRLALARALVRRPRVLLLDDATSAVDPRIESEILAGLRRDLDTTLLVVAHRVSTILLADRVLLLDAGRIVASGTHDDLLARSDYEALVRAYERTAR